MKNAHPITTRGGEQIKLDLKRILTTDRGFKMLTELRKKYEIPKNGYKPPKSFFHVDNMNMPKKWLPKEALRKRAYQLDRLAHEMAEMAHQLDIFLEYSIPSHFLDYVFYSAFGATHATDSHLLHLDDSSMNLCYISDMREAHESYLIASPEERTGQNKNLSTFYKLFPITLHISPNATGRVIRNFIEKNSRAIEAIQKKHRKEGGIIGKSRKRDTYKEQRDALVWQYRNQPRQAFVAAFIKRFPGKDYPDIGAFHGIITKEKSRRANKH